jgi:nucleoside-diphosphate-sugar epimerase
MKIFVAGATGAIGRPLVRQLVAAGHQVTGMTRTAGKVAGLLEQGAEAVVINALDTETMKEAVRQAKPEIVIDQLTDLPKKANPFRFRSFYKKQTPLKETAPLPLLEAAIEVGAIRHIMQSVAFMYAPAGKLHSEDDPVYLDAPPPWDTAIPPFPRIEQRIVDEAALEGIVLRYGFFYGPGTHMAPDGSLYADVKKRRYPIVGDGGGVHSFVHVEDAAAATVQAVEGGQSGIYNIVDDTPLAIREWLPAYARAIGAKPPRRVPRWLARLTVGAIPTHFSTTLNGASNKKARQSLGWAPNHPDPRQGFPSG